MGGRASTAKDAAASPASSRCPVNHGPAKQQEDMGEALNGEGGGCRVKHAGGAASRAESGCPVKHSGKVAEYMNPHAYNVYSQRLDPANQMPAKPNQERAPGQTSELSTARVRSNIPKGGTNTTWTYPSPQMFWNAISRKGKVGDTLEEDMDIVVAIHNNMNENTWRQICKWEDLRRTGGEGEPAVPGGEPKLLRFLGRPDDMSPKAFLKTLFGCPMPFDRHDWVVDQGGQERRYVIDYYHDEALSEQDRAPELGSTDAVRSIKVDVRPALDDARSVLDRLFFMPLYRATGRSDFQPLPFLPSGTPALARPPVSGGGGGSSSRRRSSSSSGGGDGGSGEGGARAAVAVAPPPSPSKVGKPNPELEAQMRRVHERCSGRLQALRGCEGDAECGKAAVALTYCMAQMACPEEAGAFAAVGEAGGAGAGEAAEAAFRAMQACLEGLQERAGVSGGEGRGVGDGAMGPRP